MSPKAKAKKSTKKDGSLLKTASVVNLVRAGKTAAHYGGDNEDGASHGTKDLYMPIEMFNDLGKPEVITVTIEPGDKLNG